MSWKALCCCCYYYHYHCYYYCCVVVVVLIIIIIIIVIVIVIIIIVHCSSYLLLSLMHCEWWQVAGILTGDAALVGQSLDSDVIIEPVRGPLIPGFAAVKAAAKAAGMPVFLFGFIKHVCSLAM